MRIEMTWYLRWMILWLSMVSAVSSATGTPAVRVVANYSNITTSVREDPHQSGYAVTIYQRGDGLLFGDFTFAAGSIEAVGGKLSELKFDRGLVSFKAKTSAYDGPSREIFEFKGKVHGRVLTGLLTIRDGYAPQKPPIEKNVSLRHIKVAMPISYEAHKALFQKEPW